jgi:hypothetical protein
MISFRLSVEEYDRFRELCSTCGTRSVSELARAAINSLLNRPGPVRQEALEHRVAELEDRINMLSLQLKGLPQNEKETPSCLSNSVPSHSISTPLSTNG